MALITDLDKNEPWIICPRLKHKFRVKVESSALTEDEELALRVQTIRINTTITSNPLYELTEKVNHSGLHYVQTWEIEAPITGGVDKALLELYKTGIRFDVHVEELDGDDTILFKTIYKDCAIDKVTYDLDYAISEACKYVVTFSTLNAEQEYINLKKTKQSN